MGFLDSLLNRGTRKAINNMVDRVADAMRDAVSDLGNDTANKNNAPDGDESDCCLDAAVVERRIQKILTENFSGCELRKNVLSSEIGAADISWQYTYGVYRDGYAVAMINVLRKPNDYRRKTVLQSKRACTDYGIGYVHFLLHLPNRSSYILERLRQIIPA